MFLCFSQNLLLCSNIMQNTLVFFKLIKNISVIEFAGRTPLTQDEVKQIHSISILGISYMSWHPLSGQKL